MDFENYFLNLHVTRTNLIILTSMFYHLLFNYSSFIPICWLHSLCVPSLFQARLRLILIMGQSSAKCVQLKATMGEWQDIVFPTASELQAA